MAYEEIDGARIAEGIWRVHGCFDNSKTSTEFCGYISAYVDGANFSERFTLNPSVAFPVTTSFFLIRVPDLDPIQSETELALWVQSTVSSPSFPKMGNQQYPDPPVVMRDGEYHRHLARATRVKESDANIPANLAQVDDGTWIVFAAKRIDGGKRTLHERIGFVSRFYHDGSFWERSSYLGTSNTYEQAKGDLLFYKHSEVSLVGFNSYKDFVTNGAAQGNLPALPSFGPGYGNLDWVHTLYKIV